MKYRATLLFIVSVVSFVLGISLPLLHISHFWVLHQDASLVEILMKLISEREYLLATLIFVFSILFPLLKLIPSYPQAVKSMHLLKHIHALGRWSMLDVFLMATVVFAVKTSGVSDATLGAGFYCFLLFLISNHYLLHQQKMPS